MTLSEKITYLRKREGMSQEDLAEQLSLSRQSVYKWETGESLPSMDNIKYLAKMFNVSFDYLMDDSIDSIDPETNKAPHKNIERAVFSTGVSLHYNQVNIDNGYLPTRKAKLQDGYCDENVQHAKNELKKLNITDVFQIQTTTCQRFYIY